MTRPSLESLSTEDIENIVGIASELQSNKETREGYLRLIQKIRPQAVIPEIDAQDKVLQELKTEREARESLEKKMMERDAKENIDKAKASALKKFNLRDEDGDALDKLIVEKKIGSYESAAEFYSLSRAAAEPTPHSVTGNNGSYQLPSEDWSKAMGNPALATKIGRDVAAKAIDEVIKARRSGQVLGPAA